MSLSGFNSTSSTSSFVLVKSIVDDALEDYFALAKKSSSEVTVVLYEV